MKRGFSLIEAVLSIALFALLSLVIFAFFRSAVDHFKMGMARGDLQTEARRATALLRKEMTRSTADSVNLYSSSVSISGQTAVRDRVSFASLKDWNDATQFDPNTGFPVWNQQMMFAVDGSTPSGNFGYAVIAPGSPVVAPWPNLGSVAVPPAPSAEIVRWTSLSHAVYSFAVTRTANQFDFDMQFAGKSLDSKRREEKLQLKFLLVPYNR